MKQYTIEALKSMYSDNDFPKRSLRMVFLDTKYHFETIKSTPFMGEENLEIFVEILKKIGELEYSPALYELGLLYYNGESWLPQDLEKSYHYHKKAATLNNRDALFELYIYYSTGIFVDIDDQMAFDCCKKAAELNQRRACYNMGTFYANGENVKEDIKQAFHWYKKASELGNPQASETLGFMYESGNEIEKDEKKAQDYFNLADRQSDLFYG